MKKVESLEDLVFTNAEVFVRDKKYYSAVVLGPWETCEEAKQHATVMHQIVNDAAENAGAESVTVGRG